MPQGRGVHEVGPVAVVRLVPHEVELRHHPEVELDGQRDPEGEDQATLDVTGPDAVAWIGQNLAA